MLKKYIVKNGTLLSVLNGSEQKADILVENGIISRIGSNIEDAEAEVFDAEGMYVSVGWLDSHCHFANHGGDAIGISPEDDLLRQSAARNKNESRTVKQLDEFWEEPVGKIMYRTHSAEEMDAVVVPLAKKIETEDFPARSRKQGNPLNLIR